MSANRLKQLAEMNLSEAKRHDAMADQQPRHRRHHRRTAAILRDRAERIMEAASSSEIGTAQT
ncbi:hypothetical protein [Thalassobaculum litoreum]|uniref:Uncharacterized protein n=1 Tax=Thalassobaculum litoreum DSM 18839 TaxID=1123362 RepID=A0A8G2BI03_9PROT|nr:hypothetical protein [Thalassobaculum litoreum]SDF83089.1 hypothetical protein SAMN05660686_02449 [Thalassobaculum litoreum DSM 18839]